MRNFLIAISLLLFFFTWNVQAQSRIDMQRATNEVLQDGILIHDLENEWGVYNDCMEQDSVKRGTANMYGWVITQTHVESTYVSVVDSPGGVWLVHTLATENLKFSMQYCTEVFKCDSDHVVEFGARVKIDSASATQSDLTLGLLRRNTAIDSLYDAGTFDGVYFYKADGSLRILSTALKDTVHVDSVWSGVNFWSSAQASWVKFKILWTGTRFFMTVANDTLELTTVLDSSAVAPVDELFTPTFSWLSGAKQACDIYIDYIYAKAYRRNGR